MTNGYYVYFKDGDSVVTLPVTPSEIKTTIGTKNQVINLINEGDVNVLKSPELVEIEFDALFPMNPYPFARNVLSFNQYFNFFKNLLENKRPFRFIVARSKPNGVKTWDTNLTMSLENLEMNESTDNGLDVVLSFSLKQYKPFHVKTVKIETVNPDTTSTSNEHRNDDNRDKSPRQYTVKSGDCLWNIAKKFYDDGSKYNLIYNTNKTVIEQAAKDAGYQSSSYGELLFPDTKLSIPALD